MEYLSDELLTAYHDGLHVPDCELMSNPSHQPSLAEADGVSECTTRDYMHAWNMYCAWRSWTFPGTGTVKRDQNKCPIFDCKQQCEDLQAMLLHLDKDCKELKNLEDVECARAAVHELSGTASGTSTPPCRSGRCPWHWTKSLLGNVKNMNSNLKRHLSDKYKSLRRSRKADAKNAEDEKSFPSDDFRPCSSASELFAAPPPPRYELHAGDSATDPYHAAATFFWEQDYAHVQADSAVSLQHGDVAPAELFAQIPDDYHRDALVQSGPSSSPMKTTPSPAKSWTRVSMMSETTISSTDNRDYLVSPVSSISSASTSLSQLSTDATPQDPGVPVYTNELCSSPGNCDDESDDLPPWIEGGVTWNSTHTFVENSSQPLPPTQAVSHARLEVAPVFVPDVVFNSSSISSENELPVHFDAGLQDCSPQPRASADLVNQVQLAAPSPRANITNPPHNPRLESLRNRFSEIRRSFYGHGGVHAELSTLSDEVVLLAGLEGLGNALLKRRGKYETSYSPYCFTYLALAMEAQMAESTDHRSNPSLLEEMLSFQVASGDHAGFTERLLAVSKNFLSDSQGCSCSELSLRANFAALPCPNLDTTPLASFEFMNTYFRQGLTRLTRPASPFSRQHSWDSTASTLLPSDDNDDNVTTVDEPPPDNSKDSFRHYHYAGIPEATPAIINLPSARKVAIDRQQQPTTTNLRRRHPAARTKPPVIVRCEACDFNPDPGPDQQKKLARHNLTRKHRQKITGRSPCSISLKEIPEDEGEDAEKTEEEEERFQCTFSFEDGSVCEKSFNRKDNLQQHVKRKHESDGGAEMRHRAVKRRRVDRT